MSASPGGNLELAQGYTVLAPRSGKAYPVPCDEWEFLKGRLRSVSRPPWILPAITFLLLGAALTTFITILLGGVVSGEAGKGVIIAWAVVATATGTGIACLTMSIKQYQLERTQVSEVVRQMELIEKRFEGGGLTTG